VFFLEETDERSQFRYELFKRDLCEKVNKTKSRAFRDLLACVFQVIMTYRVGVATIMTNGNCTAAVSI
jgi:hypothetical protein